MQLAHAGRKASSSRPWDGGGALPATDPRAWTTLAPSAIPFHPTDPTPQALDAAGIDAIVDAFVAAAQRADTRLVGVVFGGSTASSRDRYMGEIMDASFARARGDDLPGVEYVKDDEPSGTPVAAARPEPTVMRVKVAGFPDDTAPKASTVTSRSWAA